MAQIGWQSRYTYTPQHDPLAVLEDLDVLPQALECRVFSAALVHDMATRIRALEARPDPGISWGWATSTTTWPTDTIRDNFTTKASLIGYE